ncbi:MAG: NAD(P)-dependent alcohol dehydrogenase [Polyangiaceae bacterium]
MRVVEYDRYGDASVLEVRDRPAPTVRPGAVLVRVRAAALNPKDVLTRAGKYPWMAGRAFPKRMGYDWSGEVLEVGSGVHGLRAGDAVFGMIEAWSGGACAELLVANTGELAPKPRSLGWEEAAALPLAGSTALQALRDVARLAPRGEVLVNGASGGVGVFAVQIAKALGARVTTLTSARNADFARSLGADEALDYASWDARSERARYDVFFDVFGNRSWAEVSPVLTSRGTFVSTVPKPHVLFAHVRTLLAPKRARLVKVRSRAADLMWLADAADRGVLKPPIDRVLPLTSIAEANAALATKRTRGKIVLTLDAPVDSEPAVAGSMPGR